MTKLRVSELVNQSAVVHGEVAPHIDRGVELQLLDVSRSGLEASLGILGRDAHRDAVVGVWHALGELEVDRVSASRVAAVHLAHVADAVQRDAHGHLQLTGRQVEVQDVLGHRMLHLLG
eukprot:CAMPEP_0174982698 /NCGR_PEP_ID=MMETSP0004_2-20121128/16673_1 /TAXON_ID=420556 /ORGANISM="Ochromonas sp., Strain CCMP1393" /LENGTH=118 /DNA_ID=CAMNT_0016234749 /DNA_START=457 /DNA_END=813 /DNA_ORIENTATION=+